MRIIAKIAQTRGKIVRSESWPARVGLSAAIWTVSVFTASRAAAQGCILCYQSAAASGATGRAALRHGIVILLVPAVSLFLSILALLYRRPNPSRGPAPTPIQQDATLETAADREELEPNQARFRRVRAG
jgi:hypothetical protein